MAVLRGVKTAPSSIAKKSSFAASQKSCRFALPARRTLETKAKAQKSRPNSFRPCRRACRRPLFLVKTFL